MDPTYRTLRVAPGGDGVLSVVIDAPPMNLIGPELVRDLVSLLGELESGQQARVVVLESADPEYFVPHVDLTKVAEYTAEAAKAGGPGDASLGMLWHKLSECPAVTIAKIRGRARGAGSELALACDMRFAARENAILGQIEVGVGALPGAGGVQHLGRLLGRGRAMEAILGADDFDAETAERYGWINRALPDADLDAFVARLARRIASFPADGVRGVQPSLCGGLSDLGARIDAETARRRGYRALPDADLDAFVARLARRIASFRRRRGANGQAGAERADHARRGRDPRRCRPVPPAGRLRPGPGSHGRPVHPGPADPRAARTRPRRPHRARARIPWSGMTQPCRPPAPFKDPRQGAQCRAFALRCATCPAGIVRTAAFDVDVPFMQLGRHGWDIHAV